MDIKQLLILVLQVSIIATVFGFGLKATPADLTYLVRRPALLFRSILAVFVIMPIVAVVLVKWFEFRPATEWVLAAVSISPVPPLLPRRQARAAGAASFGLALLVTLSLLAIVVTPLWVEIFQWLFDRPLGVSPVQVAKILLTMAVLPLLTGLAVRTFLPALAAKLERVVTPVGQVLLLVGAVLLLLGAWRAVWSAVGDGTVLVLLVFVGVGLLVGHLLGGEPAHSADLALASACRHPALALSIAASNFPEEHFGGTILLYLLLNVLAGVPYLAWLRKQTAGN